MNLLRFFAHSLSTRQQASQLIYFRQQLRCYSQHFRNCSTSNDTSLLSEIEFDRHSENTLHALTDFFDSLPDLVKTDKDFDVSYSMGVLTVQIGPPVGTYVINKQTPNRQIWLSSPISGPKR